MGMKKEECIEKYGEEYYKKRLLERREWYKKNREREILKAKDWDESHKEYRKEYRAKYRSDNKDKLKKQEYNRRHNTKEGRAKYLLNGYKSSDKRYGRGECTLTSDYILERILNSSCIYCDETDWHKLGCDRIDNSLPHTPDNVVCSCWKCNNMCDGEECSQSRCSVVDRGVGALPAGGSDGTCGDTPWF